ncbi:Alpha/Beta hydrolase protein [Stachybotrys elegans]|uniref:Alpha/Beta hydrolase protein n=1 Tax=Stachybotrys elegans TaxID=80388 RepID=A0A8K0WUE1_9HYPO|nr:Alpha/Beta hydrolase protein [Stachybotrys elegans]
MKPQFWILPLVVGSIPSCTPVAHPTPFKIDVDQGLLDEARTKAKLYRPSVDLLDGTSETWYEGPPASNMTALAKYWAEEYDWLKIQDQLNSNHSHYKATVSAGFGYQEPVPLHFVHEKSTRPNAIPLLLLHGWPSTHMEWLPALDYLTSPDPDDAEAVAFDVIVPDLPGFGFSPAATHEGFGPRQAGAALTNLMQLLGYETFGIISTDAGWWVALWMAADYPDRVVGHFTDFYFAQPNATDIERFGNGQTSDAENDYISTVLAFQNVVGAYMSIQSQGPLKLGQALTDSPVGYAGWIWHHLQFSSDGYHYSFEEVITRTMMLWLPGAYGNLRTYLEWLKPENIDFPKSDVATGVSQWQSINGPFPELALMLNTPAEWIERVSNLTFLVTRPFGGHFPVELHPEIYAQDVQEFFGSLID